MPRPGGILGADDGGPPSPGASAPRRVGRPEIRRWTPGACPALGGEPRRHVRPLRATFAASTSRCSPPTAPASTSPRMGSRSRSVSDLTERAGPRRRPGQDVPPRGLCRASSPGATSRPSSPSCRARHRPRSTSSSSTSSRSRPRSAPASSRIDEAIEMIDVGGAALLERGRPQLAPGSPPWPAPAITASSSASCASSARCLGRVPPAPGGRCVRDRGRLPRRDRRLPQPGLRQRRSRSGSRWCSRRSRTCATARTPTSGPRSTARRPTGAGRWPTRSSSRAAPPSFNNLLDLDAAYRIAQRLHRPDRGHRQAHRPGRAGLQRRARRGLPARPSRPTPVAAFGGIVGGQPRARRRDRARDRRQLLRGRRRARLQRVGAGHPARRRPGSRSWPCRPTRPRACATTASPTSTSSGSAAGSWSRRQDELGLDAGQLQVVTKRRPTLEELTDLLFAWRAVRHVRSNAIVLATQRARRSASAPARPAARSRSRSPSAGPATGPGCAVMASRRVLPVPRRDPAGRANAGVTAIIQPGGSIRDEMAIEVADRHHLAMVFTGRRHFRH